MKFPYVALPTTRPVYSLGGARVRHRPLIPIRISGPGGTRLIDANLDSGSDDTFFPAYLASRLGIDLSNAPTGEATAIGGSKAIFQYATAELFMTDGYEECGWKAIVGFVAKPMPWAIIGHAGGLRFFDIQLFGQRREVVLSPNSSFSGRHQSHRMPSP